MANKRKLSSVYVPTSESMSDHGYTFAVSIAVPSGCYDGHRVRTDSNEGSSIFCKARRRRCDGPDNHTHGLQTTVSSVRLQKHGARQSCETCGCHAGCEIAWRFVYYLL